MFDAMSEIFRGLTKDGSKIFTSTSSNGFGTDVIIKNGLDQVTQTFQGLDLSQANDIIRQLLGF